MDVLGTQSSGALTYTFGTGYNACRDAYFSCMDQFCAIQNETYRRCMCSSRIDDIYARERLINQTNDELQDFKNLNIEVIPKTGAEVHAMLTATSGESVAAGAHDTSSTAKQLTGISDVLAYAKSKALSTSGTVDIAGNINQIWSTTQLASGSNISNLVGETLYNSVHAQCKELVAGACATQSLLNMVVSAYGMYIENDCQTLANALDKKIIAAKGAVRETEREMNLARLENYNAHNSESINNCIARVRADITADTACGPNYVHCLDITGKYLNRVTGEPIYSAHFYELDGQLSLDGDILNNRTNNLFINELNRKRAFAEHDLQLCVDVADEVWSEFMRQSIREIYQGQQSKIRQVKNECLDVVNTCYDTQNQQLRDFSNIKDQLLLGARLELSEQMCADKLDACSNLYGGGTAGMSELLTAMRDITNQKIAMGCAKTLDEFLSDLCAVPTTDTTHKYPYGCRTYAPGDLTDNTTSNTMYNRLKAYATQVCIRPSASDTTTTLPTSVLADVTAAMSTLRAAMGAELKTHCETLNGVWISAPWGDTSITSPNNRHHEALSTFYNETSASGDWGYCATQESVKDAYTQVDQIVNTLNELDECDTIFSSNDYDNPNICQTTAYLFNAPQIGGPCQYCLVNCNTTTGCTPEAESQGCTIDNTNIMRDTTDCTRLLKRANMCAQCIETYKKITDVIATEPTTTETGTGTTGTSSHTTPYQIIEERCGWDKSRKLAPTQTSYCTKNRTEI